MSCNLSHIYSEAGATLYYLRNTITTVKALQQQESIWHPNQ